ncbi:MAG: hypothetical protein M3361_06060, partial [Candidatus Tectomicrobia bacterium]|nr:hypothetical protein [Candidatus Tectomicrobia bacterium]
MSLTATEVMRTRAVMPRALMAHASYAAVHDPLALLRERGRGVVWRKRRSRDDVGHRTVMY